MNKIEQMFYDSLVKYLSENPSSSVYSDSWEMKIAEYKVSDDEIFEEELGFRKSIDVSFPSLDDVIKINYLTLFVESQKNVGSYTIDFSISLEGFGGEIVKIAIEIDGHEWHEKNKEQASKDKRRDRELVLWDYYIIRFTGSEVFTNVIKCIEETLKIIITLCFERYITYRDHYVKEVDDFLNATRRKV